MREDGVGQHQWLEAHRMVARFRLALLCSGFVVLFWIGLVPMSALRLEFWGPLLLVLPALVLVGIVAGHVLAPRMPFACSLTVAIGVTLLAVIVVYVILRGGIALPTVVSAALLAGSATALWSAVVRAQRIRPALRERPALLTAPVKGRALAEMRELRAQGHRMLLIVGAPLLGILAVSALVTLAPDSGTGGDSSSLASAPDPAETVAEFEDAWNRGDREALAKLMKARKRGALARWFGRRAERDGWGESLPRLREPVDRRSRGGELPQVVIWYPLEGHPVGTRLRVRFAYELDRWWFDQPKLITP